VCARRLWLTVSAEACEILDIDVGRVSFYRLYPMLHSQSAMLQRLGTNSVAHPAVIATDDFPILERNGIRPESVEPVRVRGPVLAGAKRISVGRIDNHYETGGFSSSTPSQGIIYHMLNLLPSRVTL
jgi:hypothetical protein